MSAYVWPSGEPDVEFEFAPACIICGCTDDHACEGGCSWKSIEPAVCDRCCGEPVDNHVLGADPEQWEPCPLGNKHTGHHVFWQQTVRDGDKRRKNGVRVIADTGKVLVMADFRGAIRPGEAAALIGWRGPR